MLTVISFFIVFSLLVFVHEFGHFIVAKKAGIKVEEFGFGYPPRLFTIMERGGTKYTVNAIPFGGFVRMLGEDDPSVPGGFAGQSKRVRFATLVAGSLMNALLAFVLFSLCFVLGAPEPVEYGVAILDVAQGTPAEAAGLKTGDIVLEADGRAVEEPSDLIDYTHSRLGQEVVLTVKREGEVLDLRVTPRRSWPKGQGPMGVVVGSAVTRVEIKSYPWSEALARGFGATVNAVFLTIYVPVLLIRGLIPLKAARPVGPAGIAQMIGQAAQQSVAIGWWFPILRLTGFLSATLMVTNLLPLPGLDGGRIFFLLIEAIRGKRIEPEKEGFIHAIGLIILVGILLLITVQDILHPLPVFDWANLLR